MKRLIQITILFSCLIFLVGCSDIPIQNTPVLTTIQPTNTAIALPTVGATSTPGGPREIKIWLPSTFDPEADNPASKILMKQLEEFTNRRSGVNLDIRLKAMDGEGGLLESMETAIAAAPLALPDLVLLTHPQMVTAASKGILHTFDGYTQIMGDPDWFDHAKQIAHVHDTTYGLPFASDALVLLYRSSSIDSPPRDINTILDQSMVIAFPAADPQALFTIMLYLSAGGTLLDEESKIL